jgi:hypothetical protein
MARITWQGREGHAAITLLSSSGSVMGCPEVSPGADGFQPVSSQKQPDFP